jgi:FKBP-type peptidyl-prolyl cis-trans isomerase FkpA
MSSVTTVPLRPIEKGSLAWLWLGVALVIVVALGLSWAGTRAFAPLGFKVILEGTGANPTPSDIALISYVGKLSNGTVFDQNEQAPMPVDGVVKGFSQGLQKMKRGGHYELIIPPSLGYGNKAVGPIPAGSTLHFDVKLIDFKSQAEVRQMQEELQSLRQQMPQGAPGEPPGGGMPPEAVPTP